MSRRFVCEVGHRIACAELPDSCPAESITVSIRTTTVSTTAPYVAVYGPACGATIAYELVPVPVSGVDA